ncbi:phage major capsid family protein [Rhodocyclaceae bacterium SMB388]
MSRFAKTYPFAAAFKCIGAADGNRDEALLFAQRAYPAERQTINFLKSDASGLDTDALHSTYSYGGLVEQFTESLRQFSPFDAMKAGMREVPFRTPIHSTTGIEGAIVGEGEYAPVSMLGIDDSALMRRRASSLIVMTLSAFRTDGLLAHVQRELVAGASSAVNSAFLAELASVATPETSAGSTAAHVLTDVEKLLGNIRKRGLSSLYLVVSPDHAARLACKNAAGVVSFPDMTPNGGTLAGITVLVSDQLPTDSDGHQVLLVDADAILYGDDGIELMRALSANIRMSGDPENDIDPAEVNLFVTNSTAIMLDRVIGFHVVRADAVALLTNVAW